MTGAKRVRQGAGEEVKSPCAASCPLGPQECEAEEWKRKYEALNERVQEAGFFAYGMLNEKQKYGLMVVQYLREKHDNLKVSPGSLNALKPAVKREAMDYLNTVLGGNRRRKDIVHEVFRTARRRHRDCLDVYGGGPP
jgi:RNase P/RNase MRP subunit p30